MGDDDDIISPSLFLGTGRWRVKTSSIPPPLWEIFGPSLTQTIFLSSWLQCMQFPVPRRRMWKEKKFWPRLQTPTSTRNKKSPRILGCSCIHAKEEEEKATSHVANRRAWVFDETSSSFHSLCSAQPSYGLFSHREKTSFISPQMHSEKNKSFSRLPTTDHTYTVYSLRKGISDLG